MFLLLNICVLFCFTPLLQEHPAPRRLGGGSGAVHLCDLWAQHLPCAGWGGASLEGKHNHAIVRGGGRRDNAVRRMKRTILHSPLL